MSEDFDLCDVDVVYTQSPDIIVGRCKDGGELSVDDMYDLLSGLQFSREWRKVVFRYIEQNNLLIPM